jgi:60 kDa SS-A/Ro ribonucleoprotein
MTGRLTKHTFGGQKAKVAAVPTLPVKGTPEGQKLDDRQVTNRAGGFTYKVGELNQLDRFLTLGPGSETGTYYATKWQLTRENAALIGRLLAGGQGPAIVQRIVEMRDRVAKLQPLFMASAMVMASDDPIAKGMLVDNVPQIAWTAGQFLELVATTDDLRGWGRSFRRMCQRWYYSKTPLQLAKAMTKNRNREGWRHRDVLLKANVRPFDEDMNLVFKYIVARDKGNEEQMKASIDGVYASDTPAGEYLSAIEAMWGYAADADITAAAAIARDYGLPWEVLPTQMLNSPVTFEALLPTMQPMALMRNLNKMSKLGMTEKFSPTASFIINRLSDTEWIEKSKVHPLEFMQAWFTYERGHGVKGDMTWPVNETIVAAFEPAFLASFKNVEPIGVNTLIAVDESGSMSFTSAIGLDGLMNCNHAAALMAMVRMRVEPLASLDVIGFSNGPIPKPNLNRFSSYDEVLRAFNSGGGTNGASAFEYLFKNGINVDYLEVHTDNEVWAGQYHFMDLAKRYRREVNPNFRMAVFAYAANRNTIGDPGVNWTLDVVGLDSGAPKVAGAFARGEF